MDATTQSVPEILDRRQAGFRIQDLGQPMPFAVVRSITEALLLKLPTVPGYEPQVAREARIYDTTNLHVLWILETEDQLQKGRGRP